MEKIVFYCRVSTEDQKKEGTIETQISTLENAYKNRNVLKKYIDEGFSGAFLDRPNLNQLREDAKKGLFNIIAVYNLSRFSRKTRWQLILLYEFKKLGIQVEILGQKLEDTPEGEFTTTILAATYQLQRDQNTQLFIDGKYRKLNKGILIGSYPSYGYKLIRRNSETRDEARFEINPFEAKGVQMAFKIYLEMQSYRQTIKKLVGLGFFGRGKRGQEGKNPKPFTPKTLKRILTNESYIGNWYYGKTKRIEENKDRRRMTTKNDWKLVKIPAIIDKSSFNRAQEILGERQKQFLRESKYQYLCQGLVKCVHCGRTYTAKPTGLLYVKKNGEAKRPIAYFCARNHGKASWEKRCRSRQISQNKLEPIVWRYVEDLISNPEKVKRAVRVIQEERNSKRDSNNEIRDVLIAEKLKVQGKKSKILDLYLGSNFSKAELDQKTEEYNKQEYLIDGQLKKLEKELMEIENQNALEREIEKTCLEYKKYTQQPDFELKRAIVRQWVKKIAIEDDGKIKIWVKIPELDGRTYQPSLATAIPHTDLAPDTSSCVAHSSMVEPVV